ncbi:MAG: hypothetical protein V4497_01010 [Bacteroidota bacterium]
MNSTIVLEDGKSIKIPKKVIESKQIGNILIVLTDSDVESQFNNENVYGYDLSGKELWQIKELNLFHERHDYTGIYIIDSELYIYNKCGVEVKIVAETGEVLSTELIK